MGNGWFGWGSNSAASDCELPRIFELGLAESLFVQIDVQAIYQKILTDVFERTSGLKPEHTELLWDNCVQSEASHGLISLLARAMAEKQQLYLVYDAAIDVLRKADATEQEKIRQDYAKAGRSDTGIFLSFVNYLKTDLIKLYSTLEYLTVASLHKSMNLSVAIQIKMNNMRSDVNLSDKQEVIAQAQKIAKSLSDGRDVLMDAKDVIENSVPDLTAVQAGLAYLSEKRAFYLGLPASYITGQQTTGIGTTGESDTKATERGLKGYFYSVVKPVVEAIFDIAPTYKSQDFRMINEAMNALKVFSVIDEEILTNDEKREIVTKLLDIDTKEESDDEGKLEPEQIGLNNAYPVI